MDIEVQQCHMIFAQRLTFMQHVETAGPCMWRQQDHVCGENRTMYVETAGPCMLSDSRPMYVEPSLLSLRQLDRLQGLNLVSRPSGTRNITDIVNVIIAVWKL